MHTYTHKYTHIFIHIYSASITCAHLFVLACPCRYLRVSASFFFNAVKKKICECPAAEHDSEYIYLPLSEKRIATVFTDVREKGRDSLSFFWGQKGLYITRCDMYKNRNSLYWCEIHDAHTQSHNTHTQVSSVFRIASTLGRASGRALVLLAIPSLIRLDSTLP
jgi:hypothetical protein